MVMSQSYVQATNYMCYTLHLLWCTAYSKLNISQYNNIESGSPERTVVDRFVCICVSNRELGHYVSAVRKLFSNTQDLVNSTTSKGRRVMYLRILTSLIYSSCIVTNCMYVREPTIFLSYVYAYVAM